MAEKVLHVVFEKSEADIICWIRSLEKGTVNGLVNEILAAEAKGKLAEIPCRFSCTNDVEPANCKFVIRDKTALGYIAKIPRGKIKSTLIKVIRRHIRKNSELPPPPIVIRGDHIVRLFRMFENKVREKETEYVGMSDKFSFLTRCYSEAYRSLFQNILNCYQAANKNKALECLRCIDVEAIINTAYSIQQEPKASEEEESIMTLLEFGLPDEELKIILKGLKELENNESK